MGEVYLWMTEAELILADIILLKFPIGHPITTTGLYHNVLIGLQDKYPHHYEEISHIVISSNSSVRKFLLDEEYIDCFDSTYPKDKLTSKGIQAQKLGGHRQYLHWKVGEDKKEARRNTPKKYWWLYDLAKLLAGGIITLTFKGIVCQSPKTPNVKTADPKPTQLRLPKVITPHSTTPSSKKDS